MICHCCVVPFTCTVDISASAIGLPYKFIFVYWYYVQVGIRRFFLESLLSYRVIIRSAFLHGNYSH